MAEFFFNICNFDAIYDIFAVIVGWLLKIHRCTKQSAIPFDMFPKFQLFPEVRR